MPNQRQPYAGNRNPQNLSPPPAGAMVLPESKPGKLAQVLQMPPEYVQLVKDVAAKGSTDEEFCLFLQIVHDTGLNPLTKEIWFYKMWDTLLEREMPVIHASIQGRRKAAERYARQNGGAYVPGKPTEYEYDNSDNLISATAYVKRRIEGEWHEIGFTAYWIEFAQYKRDHKTLRGKWLTSPKHMLGKCAETHALNRAFPVLENLADSDNLPTQSFAAAFNGGEPGAEAPLDPEVERRRQIIIDNLTVMADIMLDEPKKAKLAGWMDTASVQALSDKFHVALLQFTQYGKGVYDAIPDEDKSEALLSFNVGKFEDLGFEELTRFIYTYEKKAEAGEAMPTHTGKE